MKLSVSSACLFLGIIFLVSPLWISHKNFQKFLSKKAALFFSLGENDEIQKRKKQPRNNSE